MGHRCAMRVLKECHGRGVALLPQRPCENVAFPIGFWLPPLQTSPWRGGVPPRVLILRVGARISCGWARILIFLSEPLKNVLSSTLMRAPIFQSKLCIGIF